MGLHLLSRFRRGRVNGRSPCSSEQTGRHLKTQELTGLLLGDFSFCLSLHSGWEEEGGGPSLVPFVGKSALRPPAARPGSWNKMGLYGLMTKSTANWVSSLCQLRLGYTGWAGSSFELLVRPQKKLKNNPRQSDSFPVSAPTGGWDWGRGGCCLRRPNSCHIAYNVQPPPYSRRNRKGNNRGTKKIK